MTLRFGVIGAVLLLALGACEEKEKTYDLLEVLPIPDSGLSGSFGPLTSGGGVFTRTSPGRVLIADKLTAKECVDALVKVQMAVGEGRKLQCEMRLR